MIQDKTTRDQWRAETNNTYPLTLRSQRQLLFDMVDELETAIRKHKDQRGDDRCWMDDEELYKVLPEGYSPPARDSAVELKLCEKFIACRHNPETEYVSPQRRIEELEALLREMPRRSCGESTWNAWCTWREKVLGKRN